MQERIEKIILSNIEVIKSLKPHIEKIEDIVSKIVDSLKKGGKILICGNGGSASQAQHFSAELVGRFKKQRKALAALALTSDTSILTSVGNDFGFEEIFSRQVLALGKKEDILILLSTSGNSLNLIKALEAVQSIGIYTIAILGKDGGKLKSKAKTSLVVKSWEVPRIQEAHSLIIHIICELVEEEFFK